MEYRIFLTELTELQISQKRNEFHSVKRFEFNKKKFNLISQKIMCLKRLPEK
jgi:hypothetical protein